VNLSVRRKNRRSLPGFGLTIGISMLYLSLIVVIPLSALFFRTFDLTLPEFWKVILSPRALASFRITFGASLAAAGVNTMCGPMVAWSLVRYEFPGKRILDALVDLPFALPTAIAGITLTTLYAETGWFGSALAPLGIKVAFTPLGILVALIFTGLPFVVRTVQPVLETLDVESEEAAASLGAGRWYIVTRVIVPSIRPALLTGFTLAFARALGEYGSVVFISGNMPMKTEITTLLIMTRLEQYDYSGATAIAVTMLVISFALLLSINLLQTRAGRGE
jgi:sulfate transport system permease protein